MARLQTKIRQTQMFSNRENETASHFLSQKLFHIYKNMYKIIHIIINLLSKKEMRGAIKSADLFYRQPILKTASPKATLTLPK